MIPKIIHYCWFGDNPMGELENRCLASWKKFFPDYKIRKWGNEDLERLDNRYLQEAVAAKKWAFVSDYVRLHALYEEGGIYFDTDEEVRRPLDEFMEHDFFIGSQRCGSCRNISPALIGTLPHSEIVKNLLAVYDNEVFVQPDGTYNLTTNPVYFARVMKDKYGLDDVFVTEGRLKITDNAYIYPYFYFCTDNKDAYAVHHYSGSWKPDWKVEDKFKLPFGLIVRKYKKNRDGEPMPVDDNEKIVGQLSTSKRSKWTLIKKRK